MKVVIKFPLYATTATTAFSITCMLAVLPEILPGHNLPTFEVNKPFQRVGYNVSSRFSLTIQPNRAQLDLFPQLFLQICQNELHDDF